MLTASIFNGKPYAGGSTVIPLKMHLYLQALAFVQAMTLRALHADCAARFLAEKPWTSGLRWRDGRQPESADLGWVRVNVQIPEDLAIRLEKEAQREQVVLADALYTMLFWYAWALYPPLYEQERRQTAERV